MRRRPLLAAVATTLVGALLMTPTSAAPSVDTADPESETGRLVLLLDSSGSMKERAAGGGTKIAAAKRALSEVTERLPDQAEVGVRVFGAKVFSRNQPGACTDTQNVVPVAPLDRDALDRAVAGYQPYGETPIGAALRGAAKDLGPARDGSSRTIVLLSDGEPTCAPDPCTVARQLARQGVDVRINVVGLDVDGKARRALQCIARQGNGEYYDASSAEDLVNSMVKVSVRDLRGFALTGERVEGGLSSEQALPLEPGTYVDTSLPDRGLRWYLIDKPAGGGIALSTMARPTREQESGRIEIDLLTPDGKPCASVLSMSPQVLGRSPISSAGIHFNQFTKAAFDEECQDAEQLLASIKADPSDTDYRLQVSTQPAITNGDALPEPVEADEASWVRNRTIPAGAATPVVGGVNFDDAPELKPGTVHSDTLRPGEQLVYKVPVGFGQAAQLSARLGTDPRAGGLLGIVGTNVMLDAYTSLGMRLPMITQSTGVTGSRNYNGKQPAVLAAAVPPVRVRNAEANDPRLQSLVNDGHQYFVLGMAHEDDQDSNFAAPVRLTAELEGEVSGAPEYAGKVEGPTAEDEPPGDAAADDDSGTTNEPEDAGSNRVLLIGGLSLVALLIGAAAYVAGRRGRG